MKKVRAGAGVLLAASTAMLMSVPAQADTTAASSLIVDNGGGKSVTLNCDDLGTNTHPYAAEACAEIDEAKGDIARIPGLPGGGCLGLWRPVTISVTGIWQGQRLSFEEVASNTGCARISHMHVFFY